MGSTETEDEQLWEIEARAVGAGAASGLVAGVGMGIVLQFGTDLLPVLGALAGETSVVRGWAVHLFLSMVYGAFFAVIVAYPLVDEFMDLSGTYDYAFGGLVYAAMILAAGFAGTIALLPFLLELPWVTASGQSTIVPGPSPVGLIPATMFGLGHLVYGVILGAVYAVIAESH